MNLVWGLVNALQIMMLIPLINLDFPLNAQILFTFIPNIASLNVIPT
jgi:hypothetical protein